MHTILLHIHSFMAYVFLASAIISTIYSGVGFFKKSKNFGLTKFDLAKMVFIAGHIQLLLGIILWATSDLFSQLRSNFGAVMADKSLRLLALEHPLTNLIAIIIFSIGYFGIKKAEDSVSKHKMNFLFYLIGTILILSRLPYNQWLH